MRKIIHLNTSPKMDRGTLSKDSGILRTILNMSIVLVMFVCFSANNLWAACLRDDGNGPWQEMETITTGIFQEQQVRVNFCYRCVNPDPATGGCKEEIYVNTVHVYDCPTCPIFDAGTTPGDDPSMYYEIAKTRLVVALKHHEPPFENTGCCELPPCHEEIEDIPPTKIVVVGRGKCVQKARLNTGDFIYAYCGNSGSCYTEYCLCWDRKDDEGNPIPFNDLQRCDDYEITEFDTDPCSCCTPEFPPLPGVKIEYFYQQESLCQE